jgi:hypothetical protein
MTAALEEACGTTTPPAPDAQTLDLLEDWYVLSAPERRTRLSGLVDHVVVRNDLQPAHRGAHHLNLSDALRRRSATADDLLKRVMAGGYTCWDPATSSGRTGPLQLPTPTEAARVAGITPQTLRQWFLAESLFSYAAWTPTSQKSRSPPVGIRVSGSSEIQLSDRATPS